MEIDQKSSDTVKKSSEKERLELVEKKIEIQKKRLEIKKEKISLSKLIFERDKGNLETIDKRICMQTKRLENEKVKLNIEKLLLTRNLEIDHMLNEKIFTVLISLSATTIDDERTILGSEPIHKPVVTDQQRELFLDKLSELINKL